ncbi:MAG: hypothetical protein V4444_00715 [Pseudomonadota bacterium]
MLAFLALAIGKIIRHSPFDVRPFAIQIALRFEHGSPDQRIEPPSNFRNPSFEFERRSIRAKFFDQ